MSFNKHDHLYLGYNKLKAMTDPFSPRPVAYEIEGDFKASAQGAVSLTNASAKANAESSERVKYDAVAGIDPTQRTQILNVAATTLEPVENGAELATATTAYQAGSNYIYKGPCRFRVVTHDDWRSPDDIEQAPRLALWLLELVNPTDPDVPNTSTPKTVTWVLLSGTADGQLTTSESLYVTTSRAGSQTEPLFEELYCQEFDAKRASGDQRWLQGHWRGTSTRNMIGPDSQKLEAEILFRCHGVHALSSTEDDAVYSHMGWSDASTGGEALVTSLVVGTPFYVQRRPHHEQTAWRARISTIWGKIIHFFKESA